MRCFSLLRLILLWHNICFTIWFDSVTLRPLLMPEVSFDQNLSQQQVLSPQMRQSLDILQANSLELSQLLQQAIETNPVLELTADETSLESNSPEEAEHDMETLSELDDDWRELQILERQNNSVSAESEANRDHYYNSIVGSLTLQQHLLNQVSESAAPPQVKIAAQELIGELDDRGFYNDTLESIAIRSESDLRTLESAKALLQNCTPHGVGAASLEESLLIQLHHLGHHSGIVVRMVENHLGDLARRKIPEISRSLGVPIEATNKAAELISKLTPDPGAQFDPTSNPHITPDIYISLNSEGNLTTSLSGQHIPEVSINATYKELMASSKDSTTRHYLRDRIRDGKTLIRSISQRQETLLAIADELIEKQTEFFHKGFKALKPLTMNDLAVNIGVHPATISRAVNAKYMQCPQGLIELRLLFTSGYQASDGGQIANTGVKETIQQLIAEENTAKPLSDSAMEKLLKEQGIAIARRTIAKYREQLGILPSNLRKRFS